MRGASALDAGRLLLALIEMLAIVLPGSTPSYKRFVRGVTALQIASQFMPCLDVRKTRIALGLGNEVASNGVKCGLLPDVVSKRDQNIFHWHMPPVRLTKSQPHPDILAETPACDKYFLSNFAGFKPGTYCLMRHPASAIAFQANGSLLRDEFQGISQKLTFKIPLKAFRLLLFNSIAWSAISQFANISRTTTIFGDSLETQRPEQRDPACE
jgi:hypothetical protein